MYHCRLTRRREALVYNTPDGHVTRDVREGIAKLAGLRFKVLDTAGLETFTEDESILARTAGISATALRKCQIALFLVDGRSFSYCYSSRSDRFSRVLKSA